MVKIEYINFEKQVTNLESLTSEDFVINERLDDRLDTANVKIISTKINFIRFEKINITVNDISFPFLIEGFSENKLTGQTDEFEYDIRLVEPTKWHEKLVIGAKSFSRRKDGGSNYSLKDCVEILLRLAEIKYNLQDNYFSIESSFANELNSIEAPSLIIPDNTSTLRESINFILSVFDNTYKYNDGVIYKVSYNKKTNPLDFTLPQVSQQRLNDSQYLGTSTATNISNILLSGENNKAFTPYRTKASNEAKGEDYYPMRSFSTSAVSLGQDNAIGVVPVDAKLGEVQKVEIIGRFLVTGDFGTGEEDLSIDVTDYVVAKEVYDALPVFKNTTVTPNQTNTVYYSLDGDRIEGWNISWGSWGLSTTFSNMLTSLKIAGKTNAVGQTWNDRFSIKITYKPKIKNISSLNSKNGHETMPVSSIIINQSESNLDELQAGARAQSTLNRLGNTDEIISFVTKFDNSERIKLGDYSGDLIVSSIDNVIFYDHDTGTSKAIQKITLNRNFNKINEFIGVDYRKRQFEIPINEIVERTYVERTFGNLTLKKPTKVINQNGWNSSALIEVVKGWTGESVDRIGSFYMDVNNVAIDYDNIIGYVSNDLISLYKSCLKLSVGSSLNLNLNFQDNVTFDDGIGKRVDNSNKKAKFPVPYVDENGFWDSRRSVLIRGDVEENFEFTLLKRAFLRRPGDIGTYEIGNVGERIRVTFRGTITSGPFLGEVITDSITYTISSTNVSKENINLGVSLETLENISFLSVENLDNPRTIVSGLYKIVSQQFLQITQAGYVLPNIVDNTARTKIETIGYNFPIINNRFLRVNGSNIFWAKNINPYKDPRDNVSINIILDLTSKESIIIGDDILTGNNTIFDNNYTKAVVTLYDELYDYSEKSKVKTGGTSLGDLTYTLSSSIYTFKYTINPGQSIAIHNSKGLLWAVNNITSEVIEEFYLYFDSQKEGVFYEI